MSRRIDLKKPLSDEDREYLHRRGRTWDIEMNDAQFKDAVKVTDGNGGEVNVAPEVRDPDAHVLPEGETQGNADPDTGGEDEDDRVSEADVKALKADELREELSERDLSTDGNKEELQKRLLDHLRENGQLKEA